MRPRPTPPPVLLLPPPTVSVERSLISTMSGQIPFHIQEEIMKRLPVKSVIQFRSVSKAWKSLIDSSEFITAHSLRHHTQPQPLLVLFHNREEGIKYVSFIDDETLFDQRPVPNTAPYVKESFYTNIVGSSHGLVCFYSSNDKSAVIWNPSIRKSIGVDVPGEPSIGQRYVGFGVCPVTTDPKIVAIKQSWDRENMETRYKCEVIVYTLSAGNWRSLSTNLPTKPFNRWGEAVAADGFIYWLGGLPGCNMIISFDATNETFQMIDLPTSLAQAGDERWALHIDKLRKSLAIIQYDRNTYTYTVWMMESGFQRSFTKLFTIHAPLFSLVGFRKSGVPILRLLSGGQIKHVVYEANLEHNNVLEVSVNLLFFSQNSYTETLLLLGRSDCSSY